MRTLLLLVRRFCFYNGFRYYCLICSTIVVAVATGAAIGSAVLPGSFLFLVFTVCYSQAYGSDCGPDGCSFGIYLTVRALAALDAVYDVSMGALKRSGAGLEVNQAWSRRQDDQPAAPATNRQPHKNVQAVERYSTCTG